MSNKITDLAIEHDRSGMCKVIERSPGQIETALGQSLPLIPKGPFNKVILAGQGGSAFPAEVVIDAFAGQLKVPLSVNRSYNLPTSIDEKTLIIASSFSGETEEVVSAIEPLPEKASNVVVISAGGELARLVKMANERCYPVIRVPKNNEPKGFQPRSATGYMVTFLARLLSCAGVMEDMSSELEVVPDFLRNIDIRNDAEETAGWLADKIPVVYTDERHLMSIGRVSKIKFNENSKRQALFNALPEANHNEIIGFIKPLAQFGILYFHDTDSHPRICHRFEVMKQVFDRQSLNHVSLRKWELPGTTKIQKIFAALMFLDWCSYSLALLDGKDPTPVELVTDIKKLLDEKHSLKPAAAIT